MTKETPNVVWVSTRAQNSGNTSSAFMWSNPTLETDMYPPEITMPHSDLLELVAFVLGSATTLIPFDLLATGGETSIEVTSGGLLLPGMFVTGVPGGTSSGAAVVPNGLVIQTVTDDTEYITMCSNNQIDSMASTPPYAIPEDITTSPVVTTAVDEYPSGTLAATVSPSTGITISDYSNPTNSSPGDGTGMTNAGGQASCVFWLSGFPSAGTYTVSLAYSSDDNNYNGASAPELTIVCT